MRIERFRRSVRKLAAPLKVLFVGCNFLIEISVLSLAMFLVWAFPTVDVGYYARC
jgi:hypothetical protein